MSLKRVVVLGASGFIGKTLCQKLQDNNMAVKTIGRDQVDLSTTGAGQTLSQLLEPQDTVVVLSAITPDKGKTRVDFFNNLRMVMSICEALNHIPLRQIVYLSSDAVYSFDTPLINEHTLAAPADLYGAMHRSRELLLESLSVPLWVVRPTLIYGAQDTHNAYGPNRFLRQALSDRCITLFGEGEETRSHIAVEDVIDLLILGIKKQQRGISNAVTEPAYSFKAIAELIASLMPFPVSIQTQNRKGPITHRHFDTSILIRDFADWTPIDIKTGLSRMRDALQKNASTQGTVYAR